MPIWSLTTERLEKLKSQIAAKKAQHDDLEALSEKDLWCKDLDDFVEEWENQMRLDAEIQTTIRRMGRRVSKKIGAGKARRGRDDDDYVEKKPARGAAPKVAKVETKTHQRFAEMFSAKPKPKPTTIALATDGHVDDLSDDDFASLGKPKASQKPPEPTPAPTEDAANGGRAKRAAATKVKAWVLDDDDESESDDDKMLGDVGAMVKGIQASAANNSNSTNNGRLSLFAMSRPESSHGGAATSALQKSVRPKPSRTFDFDSHDDTNYEMLARPSPQKTNTKADEVDSSLSDDDFPSGNKLAATAKASAAAAPKPATKPRGRPAAAKNKPKDDKPAAAKPKPKQPVTLSPAAKAYAAKRATVPKPKKDVFGFSDDDEDDDDIVMQEPDSPVRPKPRGRPARAAATASKKKPIYIDDDEDEDVDVDGEESGGDEFDMDDSE